MVELAAGELDRVQERIAGRFGRAEPRARVREYVSGWSRAWREWQVFAHKIVGFSGSDDVQWTEGAEPAADGGVVIDVVAAGVSFADLLQTKGAYQMKVPLPYTPGMDAAGVVRSAPPEAGLAAGQRVAVLLSYGCWQEVISARAARVLPLPADMSFEAGAAAPLNYLTALFALARRARAQAGETLLVHGAAGGVGTAAIADRAGSGAAHGRGRQ